MNLFFCPYLSGLVELTDERLQHITQNHPGTFPEYFPQLEETLADPDLIRSSSYDPNALLFSKWFESIRMGRYLVVVVVSQTDPARHWILTTYTARKITGGQALWQKN